MSLPQKTSQSVPRRHTTRRAVVSLSFLLLAACSATTTPVTPPVDAERYQGLARDVFSETNRLRAAPGAYAAILRAMTGRMSEGVYYPQDSEVGVRTSEGVSAVHEALDVLRTQKPLPTLQWSEELARLARAHVADTGAKGIVSHDSSTGRSFSERVAGVIARGKYSSAAENISYGYGHGRDVVSQLFIDDGVPERGHRTNLLKPQLSHTGVACGYHSRYRHMCVAVYATQ